MAAGLTQRSKAAEVAKVRLGDFIDVRTGKLDANASSESGEYPFFTCSKNPLRISSYSYECECVLVAGNGDLNVKYFSGKFDAYQRTYIVESVDKTKLQVKYLYHFLDTYLDVLRKQSIGGVIKYIKIGNITEAKLPLPPLAEQNRIAAKLDAICAIVSKREEQLKKLDQLVKSRFVEMFGACGDRKFPLVKLGNIMQIKHGYAFEGKSFSEDDNGIVIVTPGNFMIGGGFKTDKNRYCSGAYPEEYVLPSGSLVVTMTDLSKRSDTLGYAATVPSDGCKYLHNQRIGLVHSMSREVVSLYVEYAMRTQEYRHEILATQVGSTVHHTSPSKILSASIPLPPLALQREFAAFVAEVDKSKFAVRKSLESYQKLYRQQLQEAFG